MSCAGDATFSLAFSTAWQLHTHPRDYPGPAAAFGDVAAFVQSDEFAIFTPGQFASIGQPGDVAIAHQTAELQKDGNGSNANRTASPFAVSVRCAQPGVVHM